MLGYLNAPSPFTEDGWFVTGDRVQVKDGELKILGRESDLINIGGEKVLPQEVEDVIMEIPNIVDVVVYGQPNLITGSIVCARVSEAKGVEKRLTPPEIRKYCLSRLERHKVPIRISIHTDIIHSERYKKSRTIAAPGGIADRGVGGNANK
jgi:long-chain acyl-CoA synthetase